MNDTWPASECRLPDGTPWWAASEGDTRMLYGEIFDDRVYAELCSGARHGRLIVDIGANTGLSALFFSAAAPGVPVLAVEPVPITYACLVANLARHAPGVTAVQTALGTARGAVELTYYPRTPSQSGMHADGASDDHLTAAYLRNVGFDETAVAGALRGLHEGVTTRVPCTRLDDLLDDFHPEITDGVYLKIDVERAELEVLEGLERRWTSVDGLVCEVEDRDGTVQRTEALLHARGFVTRTWQQDLLVGSDLWTVSALRRR